MNFPILIIFSYLLGSIPFGKIIGRLHGVDIQKAGSGNIGFANSLRVLGSRSASVVLLGDMAKGFIPTFLAIQQFQFSNYTLLIAFAAVLGHIFPPWLKFKGGKGVATVIGVTLALSPLLGALALVVWIIIFRSFKMAAIASFTIAILLPIIIGIIMPKLLYLYIAFAVTIFITHHSNINNLIHHKEREF